MIFKPYTFPQDYLGWIESEAGKLIAFIRSDGSFKFDW